MIAGLIVGGYTAELGGSATGVAALEPAGDSFTLAGEVPLLSPTYLARHPHRPLVYATSESRPGWIHTLQFGSDGLRLLQSLPAGDSGPAHVAVTADESSVVVANYGGGSVSTFRILPYGLLEGPLDVARLRGTGPDPERQEQPHPHQVVPDGDRVLVPDLGTDLIRTFTIDDAGALTELEPFTAPPGSGPRHAVVTGDLLVVALELSGQLLLARRSGAGWVQTDVVKSSAVPGSPHVQPSAIRVGGDLAYIANRGVGTVGVFAIDREAGTAAMTAEIPCGGTWPRDLVLSPGRIWVANQEDDVITVFDDGTHERVLELASPSPACILLIES